MASSLEMIVIDGKTKNWKDLSYKNNSWNHLFSAFLLCWLIFILKIFLEGSNTNHFLKFYKDGGLYHIVEWNLEKNVLELFHQIICFTFSHTESFRNTLFLILLTIWSLRLWSSSTSFWIFIVLPSCHSHCSVTYRDRYSGFSNWK